MICLLAILPLSFLVISFYPGNIDRIMTALGGMFYELCAELNELDWAIALQELFEIIENVAKKTNKRITKFVRSQLRKWIDGLPQYIRVYLPEWGCES